MPVHIYSSSTLWIWINRVHVMWRWVPLRIGLIQLYVKVWINVTTEKGFRMSCISFKFLASREYAKFWTYVWRFDTSHLLSWQSVENLCIVLSNQGFVLMIWGLWNSNSLVKLWCFSPFKRIHRSFIWFEKKRMYNDFFNDPRLGKLFTKFKKDSLHVFN